MPRFLKSSVLSLSLACTLAAPVTIPAQQPQAAVTADEDHQNMMDQLGIKALRPGPSGDEKAPNHANYDESKANPYPNLPDPLTLNNGEKVTTAKMWWDQRRPELIEMFSKEVYGRVPANVPKVTWTVTDSRPRNDRLRQSGHRQGHHRRGRQLFGPLHQSKNSHDARRPGPRQRPGSGADDVRPRRLPRAQRAKRRRVRPHQPRMEGAAHPAGPVAERRLRQSSRMAAGESHTISVSAVE